MTSKISWNDTNSMPVDSFMWQGIDGSRIMMAHGYGYGQDEDQGQLGAWYVMASIGLFDAKGLVSPDPSFQIGAPLFDKIEITLNGNFAKGKKFTIETSGNSEESLYIESMNLNGKPWDSVFLPYDEIMNGGDLKIGLSSVPNHQITQ